MWPKWPSVCHRRVQRKLLGIVEIFIVIRIGWMERGIAETIHFVRTIAAITIAHWTVASSDFQKQFPIQFDTHSIVDKTKHTTTYKLQPQTNRHFTATSNAYLYNDCKIDRSCRLPSSIYTPFRSHQPRNFTFYLTSGASHFISW